VVATLRASDWKERATATIGDQEWVYAKQRRQLTGRRSQDPEGTARCSARQVSVWKGGWDVDLEGIVVEARTASWWRTTHRYLLDAPRVLKMLSLPRRARKLPSVGGSRAVSRKALQMSNSVELCGSPQRQRQSGGAPSAVTVKRTLTGEQVFPLDEALYKIPDVLWDNRRR